MKVYLAFLLWIVGGIGVLIGFVVTRILMDGRRLRVARRKYERWMQEERLRAQASMDTPLNEERER